MISIPKAGDRTLFISQTPLFAITLATLMFSFAYAKKEKENVIISLNGTMV